MAKGLFKIFAFLSFVAVSLFLMANNGFSQAKQPCLFNGTVDNVKVKSIKCEIVHNAGPAYLLIQMDFKGSFWMMDLTGVTRSPGKANMLLVLKRHDGKKFAESYTGETTQNLKASPKFPTLLGFFKSAIPLKDAKGKRVLVTGDFVWDTSRFPK
ncbi:MAG: hypothetical protein KA369_23890 [Spirochaetes bacterium]|nr:hypothetical protein [Spirochaetota bacterium]